MSSEDSGRRLPDNLRTLHDEEDRIRLESIQSLRTKPDLQGRIDLVHSGLCVLYDFTTLHHERDDDELTVRLLGIRLFNAVISVFDRCL